MPKNPKQEEVRYPMYVYAVDQKAHVKIGISKDPYRRMAQLQTGNPHELHMLGVFPCRDEEIARAVEKAFHDLFEPMLVGGEWFDMSNSASLGYASKMWFHVFEQLLIIMEKLAFTWCDYRPQRPGRRPFFSRSRGCDPMAAYVAASSQQEELKP